MGYIEDFIYRKAFGKLGGTFTLINDGPALLLHRIHNGLNTIRPTNPFGLILFYHNLVIML